MTSCSTTEILWTDLREEKADFTFELSFEDIQTEVEKDYKIRANKTKRIASLKNKEYTGLECPYEYRIEFALNNDNSIIQIILLDNEVYPEQFTYNSVLRKKEGVLFYEIRFYDKKRNRTVSLFSKDHVFNVNPDSIEVNTSKPFTDYVKGLTDIDDTGYYTYGLKNRRDEKYYDFIYYIKTGFANTFLNISPDFSGETDAYYYQLSSIE